MRSIAADYGALLDRLRQWERGLVLLDYDGTLVPFAPRPELARPGRRLLGLLRELAAADSIRVGVVSGRRIEDLERLLPVAGLYLAGGHGAVVAAPGRPRLFLVDRRAAAAAVRRLESALPEALASLPGVLVENKGTSLALHTRNATRRAAASARRRFRRTASAWVRAGTFEVIRGDQVLEARPLGADKGRAVGVLRILCGVAASRTAYFGDDRTDEDAFLRLQPEGVTVRVSEVRRTTSARYRLSSPSQVRELLGELSLLWRQRHASRCVRRSALPRIAS